MIVVDRIEGTRAILEVDGQIVEIPATALPEGAGEGSVLLLGLVTPAVESPAPSAAAPVRAPRKIVL